MIYKKQVAADKIERFDKVEDNFANNEFKHVLLGQNKRCGKCAAAHSFAL